MLSNNGLCLHTAAQYMYVLLFLVLVVNCDLFQLLMELHTLETRYYQGSR